MTTYPIDKKNLDYLNECMVQRENYEAIFNSMNEGLFIVNMSGTVVESNDALYKITRLEEKQVLGRNIVDIFCDNPKCGLNLAVTHTMETGNPCQEMVWDIIRVDNSRTPAVFSTAILKDSQGNKKGIVVLFRDTTQITELKKKLSERFNFHNLIGKDRRMQEIYSLIEDVADTDANVLILGESGTGKELVAGAIHYQSRRLDAEFVKVSCAALSESLLESELFGHVKGAFTGAINDKIGRFELAHGGTIFLDEIGDIGSVVQMKLMRVLQEKEIERVGETRPRKVDVRIITATNRDLSQMIQDKKFREDLYYRLKVLTIEVPPLRQRKEDIPLLIDHFIERFNKEYRKHVTRVSPEAMDLLMEYSWPGNVRELENALEHAFVKKRTSVLLPHDFPHEIVQNQEKGCSDRKSNNNLDRDRIIAVLEQSGWNQALAARKLGINRSTIWRKIKKLNILPPTA
jgi:PAS domain S-box-containing protein